MTDVVRPPDHEDGLSDLPGFCRRAIALLAEAATLPEVRRIQAEAESWAAYAKRMGAALEARNECDRILLVAEATIGRRIVEAQEKGELATQGRHGAGIQASVTDGNTRPPTMAEVGLTRKGAMIARDLAAAGLPAIHAEVDAATREGRSPSKAKILRDAKAPAVPSPAPEPEAPRREASAPPRSAPPAAQPAPEVQAPRSSPPVDKAFEARVEAEVVRRLQVEVDRINAQVGARFAALEKRATEAEAQLKALKGRIPHSMFRLLLGVMQPDTYQGPSKAKAAEVFIYLKAHQAALAMTEAEEAEGLARVKRDQELREARRKFKEAEAAREAEKQRKAAERREAKRAAATAEGSP